MTETTLKPIVPLISPLVMGPLGVMHLPRLWLKLLLFRHGLLAEGYRHGQGGLDGKLVATLGIDVAALTAYVDAEQPDYLAFEAWVKKNATNLTPESIAAYNEIVRTDRMPEANAAKRREEFGIDDPTFALAVPLINLDDWAGFHAWLRAL